MQIMAVAQYCVDHDEAMTFNYHGKQYVLRAVEIKAESEVKDE